MVKKYKFNDQLGTRSRDCHIAVIFQNEAYNRDLAVEKKLAVFRSVDYKKNGKWSNTTWEVVINTASLVVFMSPFEGWPETLDGCVQAVQDSCTRYIGYRPTREEALLSLQLNCPKLLGRLRELDQLEEQLI